jgi:5-methylcytosine-specific restriction endonuclease McrA
VDQEIIETDAHSGLGDKTALWGRNKPNKRKAIPRSVKEDVRKRDKNQCRACGSNKNLHFDHVKPVSKGGKNTVKNLQLLCATHNLAKGTKKLKVNLPPKLPKRPKAKSKTQSRSQGLLGRLFRN